MVESRRRYFSGSTLEQAVLQAAAYHGLEPEEVAYRKVEKRHGFLKVRRRIVIEVDPERPRLRPEAAPGRGEEPGPGRGEEPGPGRDEEPGPGRDEEPGPGRGEEPGAAPPGPEGSEAGILTLPEGPARAVERYPRAAGAVALAAEKGLDLLFDLAQLRLERAVLQGEERLEIELWGEDQERLLAGDGEALLALEHLLPRLIRGYIGETVLCRVDCDNFHEIREERIRDLAQRAAAEVRRWGLSKTLEAMDPAERRIVHLTLADDPEVVTESQGDGYYKRVVIRRA